MIGFFATVGVMALVAVVIWAANRVWETFKTVNEHDSIIDENASAIKAHDKRFTLLDNELIQIHRSILDLRLGLEERSEKDDADTEGGGVDD